MQRPKIKESEIMRLQVIRQLFRSKQDSTRQLILIAVFIAWMIGLVFGVRIS